MKTLRLSMLALLAAGGLQAQYFNHVYGSAPNRDILTTGVNINVGAAQGHLMAGYTDLLAAGVNSVMAVRTAPNGVVGLAPQFNNGYQLLDAAGNVLSTQARKMIELPSGRIAIWGDWCYPGGIPDHFFLMLLQPNGAYIMATSYALPFNVQDVGATSICNSSNPNDVYVSGYYTNLTGQQFPVVMSLQHATGAINWAFSYHQTPATPERWIATDLVESPYPNTAGTLDIAVVGHVDNGSAAGGDACFFLVSTINGLPASPRMMYGLPTDDEGFNAIAVANNPFGSGPGFVVAGYAHDPVGLIYNSWAMKFNPNGGVIDWSTICLYTPASDNYAYDIIERFNTLGAWEYYVGGMVVNGVMGGSDDVVYKLGANGIPGGGNQFTFGGVGNEYAVQLDQYNAGAIGLSVFGNTDGTSFPAIGGPDFYMVKSYFNGVTACNWNVMNSPAPMGPMALPAVAIDTLDVLSQNPMFLNMTFALRNVSICRAAGVAGGSNLRIASGETAEGAAEISVFPNPLQQDQAQLTVQFGEPAAAGEMKVELWNMLGQLCVQQNITIAEGQTETKLDLGNALKPGLYHLVITQNGIRKDLQVSVQ